MKQLNHTQQILAGVLVVQLALIALVFWPRAATVAGGMLFQELTTEDITALAITDDQGEAIALQRVEGGWAVADADSFPASADKIEPVLAKILALKTDRLVTNTASSHRQLQVAADRFVRRIEFQTSAGKTYRLYLGSSPQYSAIHFRLDGSDAAYLTGELTAWDVAATATSWVNPSYLSVPAADVNALTVENANGTLTFTRVNTTTWTLAGLAAGEQVNAAQITTLLNRAAAVTLIRPLGQADAAAYGMDKPAAVVTLKTAAGATTLTLGAQDADDLSYVAKASSSEYYARVAEATASLFVNARREDYLQAEATPTP